MNEQPTASAPTISQDFIIDEPGFAAIIGSATTSNAASGILGGPRVRPTEAGLSIEDYVADTLDSIILSVIEEFQRREDDSLITCGPAQPPILDERRFCPDADCIGTSFEANIDLDGLLRTWRGVPTERGLLAELSLIGAA